MKRFLTRDEWRAWADAGKPPTGKKQFRLALRSVSLAFGKSPEWGRKALARRDREAGAMLLAGVPEEEIRIMADAAPELRATWLAQMGQTEQKPSAPTSAGPDPEEATIMLGVDPELRSLWLAQMGHADPAPTTQLGMDDDRYRLHNAAKQVAAARCLANPRLDPGETYALAAVELDERDSESVI